MEKEIVNKILDMTISLNKTVGGLEGKLNSVITHMDSQNKVNADLHSRISGVQKRVDSVKTRITAIENNKAPVNKSFWKQAVEGSRDIAIVTALLYSVYNLAKKLGI